jgi:GH25 family lysozyme M1 (1,4-beta-N-acetylmuramidase)
MRRGTAAAIAAAVIFATVITGPPAYAGGGPGSAGSSGDAGRSGPPLEGAQPEGSLPGIDVSHHQDLIDWTQVAASGIRFAIAKATEGRTFVDPLYATNKAAAESNGIAFSAYHFANPDDSAGDAIAEADHFVDTAQLAPGNLLPALDIERTGGLSEAELTEWILAWLGRVTERLGVRPMVYTSPAGWENRTGDTTAVADAGYAVLWIAHWGVEEPRLPANEWSGNGWKFWQYGNCGSVPGIEGCVDVDWYGAPDLGPVTIPSPDVTPPVVSFQTPTGVTGPVVVSFDEVVRQVSPANTYVWTPQTGTYPATMLECRSGKDVVVDCAAGDVRTAILEPLEPLLPGETYEAVVNPAIVPQALVDRSGNPAPTSVQGFAPPAEVEQGSPALSYAWRTVSKADAYGGSYAVERRSGATASFSFTGRSVSWYTVTGPAQGKASVSIDGQRVGTFDQYSGRAAFRVARTFGGLERAEHTITIRVLGTAAAGASDTQVVVDAFEAGGDLVRSPLIEAAWGTLEASRATEGRAAMADLARASVELTFRGTGLTWVTIRRRDQGRAELWVDGLYVRTVDNYAPTPTFGVERTVTGLADSIHTLRIVVLGESRPAAKGTLVSVDRLVALP